MTLALYGKSRKRQGSLLLAALLAVIAATIGGLALIGTAFAHNSIYTPTVQCDGSWTASAIYTNGLSSNIGDRRLVVLHNFSVNGVTVPTGSSGLTQSPPQHFATGPDATQGLILNTTYGGALNGANISAGDYIWIGAQQPSGTLFNMSGSGFVSASWSGSINLYSWNGTAWTSTGSDNDKTITAPTAPANCNRTIQVQKILTDRPGSTTTFTGTISPGSVGNTTFSLSVGSTRKTSNTVSLTVAKGVAQTVAEDAAPSGWTLVGYQIVSSSGSCSTDPRDYSTANVVKADDKGYLVCIMNTPASTTVTVTKSDDVQGSVAAGTPWNWTITITVAGGKTNKDVTVADTAPSGITFGTSPTLTGSGLTCGTTTATQYNCTLPSGAAIGTYTIKIPVTAVAATPDSNCKAYQNTVTSKYGTTTLPDRSDTVTVTGCTPPSVTLSKTDSTNGQFVVNGGTFNWVVTATVANGPTAADTMFLDNVPAGAVVSSVAAPSPLGCFYGGQLVMCTLAEGTPTGSYAATITVTPAANTCGAYPNTANMAVVPGQKPSSSNTDTVTVVGCKPGLTLTKSADNSQVSQGGNITYTLNVGNTGNAPTSGTNSVVDTLPASTTFVSGGNGTWSCANNSPSAGKVTCTSASAIASGSSSSFTITVTTAANVCGKITNSASVSGGGDGSATASDAGVTVVGCPPTLSKVADPAQTTTTDAQWTITVDNTQAGAVAQQVLLKDANPVVGSDPTGCNGDITSAGMTCNVAAGTKLVFNVHKAEAAATCQGTTETNTVQAWLVVPGKDNTPLSNANASNISVTVPGDTSKCDRTITLVKLLDDGTTTTSTFQGTIGSNDTFTGLAVSTSGSIQAQAHTEPGSQTADVVETPETPGFGLVGYAVFAGTNTSSCFPVGAKLTLSATAPIPADGGDYVVCIVNDPLPQTVTFEKVICDDYQYVPANADETTYDQTGGFASFVGTSYSNSNKPVGLGDYDSAHCHLASGWSFNTYDSQGPNDAGGTLISTYGPTNGSGIVSATLNSEEAGLISSDGGLWISEVPQPGVARFGGLRCYQDVLHGDNLEVIRNVTLGTANINCIAYNVALPNVGISKTADNSQVSAGSPVGFTVTVSNSGGEATNVPVTDVLPTIPGYAWNLDSEGFGPTNTGGSACSLNGSTVSCTIPSLGNGASYSFHVTASATNNGADITADTCSLVSNTASISVPGAEGPSSTATTNIVNCTGTVIVKKVVVAGSSVSPDDTSPQFTGTFNGTPWGPIGDGGSATFNNVVVGTYTVAENKGTVALPGDTLWQNQGFYLANSDGVCPLTSVGQTQVDPTKISVTGNHTTVICVLNFRNQPDTIGASVTIFKVVTGNNPNNSQLFSLTVTPSTASANTNSVTNTHGFLTIVPLTTDTPNATFSAVENSVPAGYQLLGYKLLVGGSQACPAPGGTYLSSINGQAIGTASALAYTVCVYNQPMGQLTVNKTTLTNGLTDGNNVGWKFNVSSVACAQNFPLTTGAGGTVTSGPIPACTDYVVTENTASGPVSGYVVLGNATQTGIVVPAGGTATANFTNVRQVNQGCTQPGGCVPNIPQCTVNCTPTPTPTVPTPTPSTTVPTPTPTQQPPSPTSTTTVAPTATPTTPISIVEGAKTPGPGSTPIAPSTGSGFFGSNGGGFNALIAALGLLALTAGFAILGLNRRQRNS